MKKKLSAVLAVILAFCMSIPVFAAGPSDYPTKGDLASEKTTFTIQKNYVKLDGATAVDRYPDETLKFKSTCTAAPVEPGSAPNLSVRDLSPVAAVTSDITVDVPAYTVPGKYNYKIEEQSPSVHTPGSKDTAGVVYDKTPVCIQVVVKFDNGVLKKIVTVAENDTTIGAGNELNQTTASKKADFKNKYLLDGEIDPDKPGPTDPNPNPIPDPDPNPDPIPKPEPDPGETSETTAAKFRIMKHVRGPLASREQEFDVTVTLTSEKPVRSDIICNDGTEHVIAKVGANASGWTGNDANGYTATINLAIKNGETVKFQGVPAGVSYTVKEDAKHIGQLTDQNLNDPSKGYTVAYYGGGTKLDNPTTDNPGQYGANLSATGIVGYDKNNNIIISNSKGMNTEDEEMVKPNTGISLDSLPYILILGLVVLGAGMMIVKSHRRREE